MLVYRCRTNSQHRLISIEICCIMLQVKHLPSKNKQALIPVFILYFLRLRPGILLLLSIHNERKRFYYAIFLQQPSLQPYPRYPVWLGGCSGFALCWRFVSVLQPSPCSLSLHPRGPGGDGSPLVKAESCNGEPEAFGPLRMG